MSFPNMISDLKTIISFYNFGKRTDLYKRFLVKIEELENREDLPESQVIHILSDYLIQYLFKFNLYTSKYSQKIKKEDIKQVRYKNNLRHKFPSRFGKSTQKKIVSTLKLFIEYSGKNIILRYNDSNSYFNVSDFTSIINIIFCWKDSLFELDPNTKKDIKKIFRKSNVLVYFKREFLNRLFGENGLLAREHLSRNKFIDTLNTSRYTKNNISHYKDRGYLPVGFLDLVCNQYPEFNDYFQFINYVKLGKSTKEEGTNIITIDTLNLILSEVGLFREFIPSGSTDIGWILKLNQRPSDEGDNPIVLQKKYETLLQKKYTKKIIDRYQHHVDLIKSKLQTPKKPVVIISLELTNFRSYGHEIIHFEPGVNVLYGRNGSGKSSIIEAILFGFLQLHPRFSLNYIPDDTYTFNPIYIFVSNTWLIRRGAPFCEVSLVLKVGNKATKISRRIERNGFQIIKIEDKSIFEGLEELSESEGISNIFLKSEGFFKNSLEEQFKFQQKHRSLAEGIFNKFREKGLLFERDEIFTSYFTEFQYFWKWENQDNNDIRDFYSDKLGLGYLDSLINSKEMIRKEEVESKSKLSDNLSSTLSGSILYNLINRNEWFKIQSGDCHGAYDDELQFREEIVGMGRGTDVDGATESSEFNHEDTGVFCPKCGMFYCWECMYKKDLSFCPNCKEEDGSDTYLPYEDTRRRAYESICFDDLFESENFKIGTKIKERKDKKINQSAVRRLKLSREILEKFFTSIFKQLKQFISVSAESKQEKIDLADLKRLTEIFQPFRNLDILTYYSTIMLYILYKMTNRYEQTVLDSIDNLLSESKIRVHKKLEEFQSARRESKKNKWRFDDFRVDTHEFEKRIFNLLYYIYVVADSKTLPQEFRDTLHDSKYYNELLRYREVLKEFVYPDLEIVDKPLESYSETKIYFEYYQIELLHELDYKILLQQVKNQFLILSLRDKYLKDIGLVDSRIQKLDKELLFLRQNFEFVYKNVYLQYLNTEIKGKSPQIFDKDDFYAFINENGFPRLQYNDIEESAPIVILSNGEKSKLFLAILGTLLSLSNRNQFLLIDEPNEFLDPENTDLMKEYFTSIFENKQLILCTFIKEYKEFQPAMIYEVKKGLEGKSEVTRLKF